MVSSSQHILIAGGAGFVGSHLCDYFVGRGFEVTCVDNLLTGRRENIAALFDKPNFTFQKLDICRPFEVDKKIDYMMNLASLASPKEYYRHPIETLTVGSVGTLNLLELARKKKAITLLASTSEVYGDPKVHPQSEEYWGNVNPIGPRSCYDESKRFSESLTMFYHRVHGLETCIARIFNTYGPRMRLDDGRALPSFLSQALKGQPLTIFGDGTQTRSFCYVSDMVEGLAKLLFSNEREPVNLGNPHETSLLDFAKLVLKLVESPSVLLFRPPLQDDPKRRRPDISKARRILNWEPTVTLEAGLKKTVPYFQKAVQKI